MLLKSIDIQGFKTFPDKTSLKFDDKTVAVVGPNGSGKSNVSDAIRWVLGEQSARVLRCSKMEDIIFKGTTSRKALGYAEVTMNIDNSDRTLNFNEDNLSVTRKYYRSGESEYLINKASVRLKDINELFMDTGLGRDGYSVIGQGKIDAIVAAKSHERREIFEEASGISKYRYKKEESERRLNKTEENLVRLRDILTELEQRVGPLKVQSEKAAAFIELDKEKTALEIGLWVQTLVSSEKILRKHAEDTGVIEAQHNAVLDALDKIAMDTQGNEYKLSMVNAQLEVQRQTTINIDENILKTESELSVFENDISHNNKNIQRVKEEIQEAKKSDEVIDVQIQNSIDKVKGLSDKLEVYNKNYIELSDKLESIRENSLGLGDEIEVANADIAKLNLEISEHKVRLSSASSSVNEIENRAQSLEGLLKENLELKAFLSDEVQKLKLALSEIKSEIVSLNNSVNGYEIRLQNREKRLREKREELSKARLDMGEQERRVKLLEALEKNFEGFTHSVKIVMKESERGTLRGVHGPVTQIIKAKPEHAVAVETALGMAMQNIVVDNDRDAKDAIALLKKRDGGRATFLPLSTIDGRLINVGNADEMYGFIGIASDLVSCEAKYDGIKRSLLGRTVLAEDLDSAVNIAKKTGYKFRLVSLDGQVVNAGGSLTGGSLAKNSGLLSRGSEIERIKQKVKSFSDVVLKLEAEETEANTEFVKAKQELEGAKAQHNTAVQDEIKASAQLNSGEKELEASVKMQEQLSSENGVLDKRLTQLKLEMQKNEQQIKELTEKLNKKSESIEDLGKGRRDNQRVSERLSTSMQEIRLDMLSAEKERESAEEIIGSLKVRKAEGNNIFNRLLEQISASEGENELIQAKMNECSDRIDGLKIEKESSLAKTAELSSQREELETSFTKFRAEEKDLFAQKENTGKELARLSERTDNLRREYDTITAKLWDEYELTVKEAKDRGAEIEDLAQAKRNLGELKNKIRALGVVNLSAIEEYKEVLERYTFLKEQVDDVEKSRNELIKLIAELTKNMKDQFALRFSEIASNFTEIFKELFGGGTANLSFTDDSDILSSGIEIKVHPPGKIVSHIESLSGGEKALVAISIYFAIMKVNPPPFCMLDEVEAALDDVNVRRFSDYLHSRMVDKTQFVLITHRRGTMEAADILYGVTMQDDGISKILTLENSEIEGKIGKFN